MGSMRISGAGKATIRGLGFRSIAWILVIAFSLQSLITQTHIHNVFEGQGGLAIAKTLTKGSADAKLPSRDRGTNCPFCQAIAHAGAFFTPPALSLLQPPTWAEIILVPFVADARGNFSSHPWHSRAPPQR